MTQSDPGGADRREHTRAPIRFNLVYDSLSAFVSEFCGNISHGGVFVVVERPPATGTRLAFSLRLADGFSLVQGSGEVVWSRQADETSERPAGMAIRFLELEEGSGEVIERILVEQRRLGHEGFHIDGVAPSDESQSSTAPATESELLPAIEKPVIPPPVEEGGSPGEVSGVPAVVTEERSDEPDLPDAPPLSSDRAEDDQQPPTVSEFAFSLMENDLGSADGREPRRLMPVVVVALVVLIPASILILEGWLTREENRRATTTVQPTHAPGDRAETDTELADRAVALVAPTEAMTTPSAGPAPTLPPKPHSEPPAVASGMNLASAATRLLDVDATATASGTEVRLVFNGVVRESQIRHERLENPPRLLVRIIDIPVAYGWMSVDVGGPHVESIRLGYHEKRIPPEQHAVLDLTEPEVVMEGLEVADRMVLIQLR